MDGYLAGKNHELDWLDQTGSVEETDFSDFYQDMDITIMGKRTYEATERLGIADNIYPTTKNYVFTHAKRLSQEGFVPVSGDVAEFVKELGPDQNIWIVGGNTVLSPLLDRDMVDYLYIQVAPVLLGEGIPLFTQKEALRRFHLDEVKRFGQFAELVYARNQ